MTLGSQFVVSIVSSLRRSGCGSDQRVGILRELINVTLPNTRWTIGPAPHPNCGRMRSRLVICRGLSDYGWEWALPDHRNPNAPHALAALNRRKPDDRPLFLADRKRQEDCHSSRGIGATLHDQADQYRPRGPAHFRLLE